MFTKNISTLFLPFPPFCPLLSIAVFLKQTKKKQKVLLHKFRFPVAIDLIVHHISEIVHMNAENDATKGTNNKATHLANGLAHVAHV